MSRSPEQARVAVGRLQALPLSVDELYGSGQVADFLARQFIDLKPAVLLRYGDTGGRVMARPPQGSREYEYLQRFLGMTVTPDQIDWLASKIEDSVAVANVIGLRSDLFGPAIPADFLSTPDDQILARLTSLYPIRPFEQTSLKPDDARRLAETRKAMENLSLPSGAILTDAWVHVGLAEIGFYSALLRHAPAISVCTSSMSRQVMKQLATALPHRLRVFECPAYPLQEKQWGGDHSFLWDRWLALIQNMRPTYEGEPLLVSAGIWTKVIAPAWAKHGGIAIDMGSVMDFFVLSPVRPAVLATRYDDPKTVPDALSIQKQLARQERVEDFLVPSAFPAQ